jgi:hypothetical protein
MAIVQMMFGTGDKADFERMLNAMLLRVKTEASRISAQVEAEAASRGSVLSSGTSIRMEQLLTPIHENALADAMRLIVQFSQNTKIPIAELSKVAGPRQSPITVPRLLPGQPHQLLTQRLIRSPRSIPITRHRNRYQPAHPALAGSILRSQPACIRPSVYELRPFFAITAFSIALSRLRSATRPR